MSQPPYPPWNPPLNHQGRQTPNVQPFHPGGA